MKECWINVYQNPHGLWHGSPRLHWYEAAAEYEIKAIRLKLTLAIIENILKS